MVLASTSKPLWQKLLRLLYKVFFDGVRPMIVTNDSEAADAHAPDTMAQEVFHKVSGLQVTMSKAFFEQFVSEYMSEIYRWAFEVYLWWTGLLRSFFRLASRC